MATAYAALVSLTHLMEHIQIYNVRKRIFIDEHQRQLEFLREKVGFLLNFLESYCSHENDGLEYQITEAANAAEDVIELYVLLDIHNISGEEEAEKNRISFLEILPSVIEGMDFVQKQVMEIKEKGKPEGQPLLDIAPMTTPNVKYVTVGLDDDFNKIVYTLRGKQHSNLQIIPITGMGGIGKTTLAKLAYDDQSVEKYFDIRDWITMSQDCDILKILRGLAHNMCLLSDQSKRKSLKYQELGEKLYKHLYGRRYLIVLDDMWSLDVWEKLRLFLPDNNNGSRIIVTTRLSNVATYFRSSCIHKMELLYDDTSWSLLCRKVFHGESCPPILEAVGKKIAKGCKGLPLSIVVMGGLLEKSRMDLDYWKHVARDVSTIVNSENNDHCFKILSLSYRHLPVYLKPCFLYMSVFPEDQNIRVSRLIKLWVGEGFLKPKKGKILEEVADDYLIELIDRNLIQVSSYGSTGRIKFCKIHDLLRHFCMKEAQEETFLLNTKEGDCSEVLSSNNSQLRIATDCMPYFHEKYYFSDIACHVLVWQAAPLLRSLIYNGFWDCRSPQLDYKLLRVLYTSRHVGIQMSNVVKLFNLRYFEVAMLDTSLCDYSLHRFWNLQTLSIQEVVIPTFAPSEIWEMPQLRHVMINGVYLRDPPEVTEMQRSPVLENLRTLRHIINFRLSENVLKRIPNINRLRLNYADDERGLSHYGICNLVHLHQLQSLKCSFLYNSHWPTRTDLLQNLHFPSSLKKLNLRGVILDWEDITTKIGILPNLEKFVLNGYFIEEVWNPVDGQFVRLKFLGIQRCNLAQWTAESTHFPSLVHLFLDGISKLEEIPSGLGEIMTLELIRLVSCNDSLVASTMKMLEEQRDVGNEDIRLHLT